MDCATYIMCEGIVIEILRRLPVKSLVRFMAVCRLWKSIISSPQFRLDSKRPSKLLVQTDRGCYILVEEDGYRNCVTPEPDFPFFINPQDGAHAIGCDNGLLCIGIRNYGGGRHHCYDRVIIWNPFIRKHVVVTPDNGKFFSSAEHAWGFGGTTISGDYKYVRVVSFRDGEGSNNKFAVDTYSLKADTWRMKNLDWDITQGVGGGTFRTCALLRGRLHWIGGLGKQIFSFELEDEVFDNKIIMLPESIQSPRENLDVTVITESLAVITTDEVMGLMRRSTSVWVMKKYGDFNSWNKLWTIVPERLYRLERNMVHLMKDGEVFLGLRGIEVRSKVKLVTYNPKTMKTCDIGGGELSTSCQVRGFTYNESLVLLGDHRAIGVRVNLSYGKYWP